MLKTCLSLPGGFGFSKNSLLIFGYMQKIRKGFFYFFLFFNIFLSSACRCLLCYMHSFFALYLYFLFSLANIDFFHQKFAVPEIFS